MNRNMIAAHERIFSKFEAFCASRGAPASSVEGRYRYIEGDVQGDDFITRAEVTIATTFGFHRAAAQIRHRDDSFVALVGFDGLDDYLNVVPGFGDDVEQVDLLPEHAVVILSELDIRPIASGVAVYDFVEAASSDDKEYEGHELEALLATIPRMAILRSRAPLTEGAFEQLVARFAIAEGSERNGWIGERLRDELISLVLLSYQSFPNEAVGRAALDSDPRNLFMALYRCLEATYAHKASSQLARDLGLSVPWVELAVKLDRSLSWRPREAESLSNVLAEASPASLKEISRLLGSSGTDLVGVAAKAIYTLRNRLVHFGPARDSVSVDEYDWQEICQVLTGIVFDVHQSAFPEMSGGPMR